MIGRSTLNGATENNMFNVIKYDDTPGWRESLVEGPFSTLEEAQAVCDDFNQRHRKSRHSNWSAWVEEYPTPKEKSS